MSVLPVCNEFVSKSLNSIASYFSKKNNINNPFNMPVLSIWDFFLPWSGRRTANMNDIKKMFILMIFARLRQPFSPKNNKKFPNKTSAEMFAFDY